MYLAYKYAKKKKAERQAAREAAADATSQDGATPPETKPDSQAELTSIDGPNTPSSKPARSPKEKHAETAEEKAAKKARRSYRWKILLGTCLPFALQALDMTVVASALPFIAEAFNSVNELNWIISSYNLTSAAFLPFWAQTTDIFGRHAALQSALILMLIGSALCTGAPTYAYGVLLLGRALQGIASAGIMISVRTILADKGSLRDYSVNWTLFSLLNAVTFSVGPLIGGYLTQTSWRWCFAINLPVGVAAMAVAFLILRKELLGPQPIPELGEQSHLDMQTHRGRLLARLGTIDYGGQLLFLWGLGLMILAFTWAGGSYSWGSANVLAPLVIGAVLTVAWVLYEYSMAPPHILSRVFARQRAMIRWELLVQKDVGLLLYINFCVGAAMFAVMYFMDLYFAVVLGQSSSKSGTNLLYFLPGLGIGAYLSMFGTNIWPRQTTPTLILGSITSAVGITVLAFATYDENQPLIFGMMALVGTGVGLRLNTASLHALAFFPDLTAQITCLVAFAVPFGGTVILTIMSTVFNNKTNVNDGGDSGVARENVKQGVKFAFVAVMPFMWLCVVLCGLLGNVWIEKGEGAHQVSGQMWVVGLLTGRKMVKETKQRAGYGPGGVAPAPGAVVANGEGDLEEGKGNEIHEPGHEGLHNGKRESDRE